MFSERQAIFFFFFLKSRKMFFQLKIIQDLKFGYRGKGIAEYEKQDRLVFACESTDGRTVHLVLMDLPLRRQNHKRC
jgi:energy-coupling factor transporter ATP-binding protein EcfA2